MKTLKSLMSRDLSNFDLIGQLSIENQKRIGRLVEIIKNQLDIANRKSSQPLLIIPLKIFERESYTQQEVKLYIEILDKVTVGDFIKVVEKETELDYLDVMHELEHSKELTTFIVKKRLPEHIIIKLKSPATLQSIIKKMDTLKTAQENKDEALHPEELSTGQEADLGSPAIIYNPITGFGEVHGKVFKFKDDQPEFRLFAKLYEKINNRILRYEVLILIHFYEEGEEPDFARKSEETNSINIVAKKIRSRTKLSIEELVVNNGNMTLFVKKLPNSPQN